MSAHIRIKRVSNSEEIKDIEALEKKYFCELNLNAAILIPSIQFLGFVLVAKYKETVVGHVVLLHTKTAHDMYCASLVVTNEYRRRGIATRLLKEAETICLQNGMNLLIATVSPYNVGSCKTFLNKRKWYATEFAKGYYRRDESRFILKKYIEVEKKFSKTIDVKLDLEPSIASYMDKGYYGTEIIADKYIRLQKVK